MSRRSEAPKTKLWAGDGDESNSLEQVADEIYGPSKGPALESGRVVARPTPLNEIWADVKQPRRAVPASIRLHWDGNPGQVATLLDEWRMAGERLVGQTFEPDRLIKGLGEGMPLDEWPALARDYVELCRLAASIRTDGLLNPINVAQIGPRTMIIAGERRWLAYWLLAGYTGDTSWLRIPAQTISDVDHVWKQAAENTARRQLNAIGMARQLALLVMATRKGDPYQEFDEVVTPGVCDRRYYAQVADGNVHRIPKGMGERIEAAMGISMNQIRQYRALLRLTDDDQVNDALWLRADVEDWGEGTLRNTVTGVTVSALRDIVTGTDEWTLETLRGLTDTLTAVKVSAPATPRYPEPETAPRLPAVLATGDTVIAPAGGVGRILGVSGGMARVRLENGTAPLIPVGRLRKVDAEPVDEWPEGSEAGMAVEIIHTGEAGVIERRYTDQLGRRFLHVNISGYGGAKALEEVMLLEMSWPDFLRQEADEGGITLMDDLEDDDEPTPGRVSAPVGMPPVVMRPSPTVRGGNEHYDPPLRTPMGSDKADSGRPLWRANLPGLLVMGELRRFAREQNNTEALRAMEYLFALTAESVQALGDDFADEIGPRYDTVMNCMVDAMHSLFDELEAAREREAD